LPLLQHSSKPEMRRMRALFLALLGFCAERRQVQGMTPGDTPKWLKSSGNGWQPSEPAIPREQKSSQPPQDLPKEAHSIPSPPTPSPSQADRPGPWSTPKESVPFVAGPKKESPWDAPKESVPFAPKQSVPFADLSFRGSAPAKSAYVTTIAGDKWVPEGPFLFKSASARRTPELSPRGDSVRGPFKAETKPPPRKMGVTVCTCDCMSQAADMPPVWNKRVFQGDVVANMTAHCKDSICVQQQKDCKKSICRDKGICTAWEAHEHCAQHENGPVADCHYTGDVPPQKAGSPVRGATAMLVVLSLLLVPGRAPL